MAGVIRKANELVEAGLVPPEREAELAAVAARYAVSITQAVAALIDAGDANDPIARQFVPDARELATAPEELADPIGDHTHEPVKGIVHRYPDRVLLKPLHVCPVYCRFCFRREDVGPGERGAVAGGARGRARLHPRACRDLGSDLDRRRSADAVAAAAERDRARRSTPFRMSR